MADNRLQVAELDFDTIKTNLKSYLQQQSEFQDYDFEGSGLSVLINLLAYNTHYNAYYLNMVANESFLDTALLRDSVVSHAKTLGYIPYSKSAATAAINVTIDSGSSVVDTLTIPKGFRFISETIDNNSYIFNVMADATVTKSGTQYFFENLEIKEGEFTTYSFTQSDSSNPKSVFEIPDSNIDTNTLTVTVRPSSGNSQVTIYNSVRDVLDVTAQSEVYFLQESKSGKYKIYFGDGFIGKKINDGAVVTVTYLSTSGSLANKASAFTVGSDLGAVYTITVNTASAASGGAGRETVSEIKYNASSQFATQNRLVTFKDYESYITRNYPQLSSISVWGGEDQIPPVYGKVFVSIKPKEGYYLSQFEKQRILNDIISPKSIVSVQTQFADPEYLYLLVSNYIQYDPKRTTLSENAIKTNITNAIVNYKNTNLDRFSTRFILSKLQEAINAVSLNSIIGSETIVRLQKRLLPILNQSKNYTINYNAPLHRGTITNKLTSTSFNVNDTNGVERTVVFDEIEQAYSGVNSIQLTDAGSGYVTAPTVTIVGDGSGAEAEAVLLNGRIQTINMIKRGIGYTRALVTIEGGSGYGATGVAVIDGRVGTIRTIYYDSNAERQIVDDNVGFIDYDNGIIQIYDINILSVGSPDGYIRIAVESDKTIVETVRNTIITIDETDPTAITIELVKASS
jgi:hypothetical protein